MKHHRRLLGCLALLAGCVLVSDLAHQPAQGYVEAGHSLGQIVNLSSYITLVRVKSIDRTKNLIIYTKVRDLKGNSKQTEIRHTIGKAGFKPIEWQTVMKWAEVGKEALFFHNGSQSEMCIGKYWYQAYGNVNDVNSWWSMTHGEPFLCRAYCGKVDKLVSAVTQIMAGKEVIVPCMVDGNKDDLHLGKAKIQRIKASLKLDYNPKRDFVGWGGEDFRRLAGMPGFTHYSSIARVDPDAQLISVCDYTGDGKPDVLLGGAGRVVLLENAGDSLSETGLPDVNGARSAVWADYNGDGLPDLLLATSTGPKLFTNLGKKQFRDDSHLLPREPGYNLTCAAWIDQDGDGKPDILLGNGFHGLRLYRNKGKADNKPSLELGDWHYMGPFDNAGGKGFAAAYAPEKKIDLKESVQGKGEKVTWKKGKFTDGQVNSLALFKDNNNAVVYLYREITCAKPMKLPCSFGSDDGIVVWLNGKKLISNNTNRAAAADQDKATLELKAGSNELLIKVIQGTGDWAFYFKPQATVPPVVSWTFEDVSDAVGLGEGGIGANDKGDALAVCDIDGDGKTDFLYSAGSGIIARNTGTKFVLMKDTGITFETGQVGPVFVDYDGDGLPDLFVPQKSGCKLFRNTGKGKFEDVTKKAGLDTFKGYATSAAWGDVDGDGQLDLVIGCLNSPNRFYRQKAGSFTEASEVLGLEQRIFNTQAVALVDLNNDGALDLVLSNEGQESCVMLGSPEMAGKRTPVTLTLTAKTGATGSQIVVRDSKDKIIASHLLGGGDGRGGQASPVARFMLSPAKYTVEVRFSNGETRTKEMTVPATAVRGTLDEKMPLKK